MKLYHAAHLSVHHCAHELRPFHLSQIMNKTTPCLREQWSYSCITKLLAAFLVKSILFICSQSIHLQARPKISTHEFTLIHLVSKQNSARSEHVKATLIQSCNLLNCNYALVASSCDLVRCARFTPFGICGARFVTVCPALCPLASLKPAATALVIRVTVGHASVTQWYTQWFHEPHSRSHMYSIEDH